MLDRTKNVNRLFASYGKVNDRRGLSNDQIRSMWQDIMSGHAPVEKTETPLFKAEWQGDDCHKSLIRFVKR